MTMNEIRSGMNDRDGYLSAANYCNYSAIGVRQAHGAYSAFEPGQLAAIPLAYGVFCVAFDFCIPAYFYARRAEWIAAWKAVSQ